MAPAPVDDTRLVNPEQAWAALAASPNTLLVDVRTRAEWAFVGAPDLSTLGREPAFVEWLSFPDMRPNPGFAEQVAELIARADADRVYFICRSGVRSDHAARAMQAHCDAAGRETACFNVVEGFEGGLDPDGRRGRVSGWKARGLPWRQS